MQLRAFDFEAYLRQLEEKPVVVVLNHLHLAPGAACQYGASRSRAKLFAYSMSIPVPGTACHISHISFGDILHLTTGHCIASA
eukprot:2269121-Rhodomonas_salina.1